MAKKKKKKKPSGPPSKLECYRKHFKERVIERFGLEVNRHDIRDIETMIVSGRSMKIADAGHKTGHDRSVHCVRLPNNEYAGVLYDHQVQSVVTVFPRDHDCHQWFGAQSMNLQPRHIPNGWITDYVPEKD